MTVEWDPEEMTGEVRTLLAAILKADLPGFDMLRAQVPVVQVVGGPLTMLELALVDAVAPADIPDGPLPVIATVAGESGPSGEILVWLSDGYLRSLEYAWWIDESPSRRPLVKELLLA